MEHFFLIIVYKNGKTLELDFFDNLKSAEKVEKIVIDSCLPDIECTYIVSRTIK